MAVGWEWEAVHSARPGHSPPQDAEEELPLDVLDDIEGEAKEVAKVGNGDCAFCAASLQPGRVG